MDKGKITNFHFTLNRDNLIPVLREIDPEIFKMNSIKVSTAL